MTDEVKQVLHVYDGDGGVIIRENGNISTFGKQSVAVDQALAALSGTQEAVEPVALIQPEVLAALAKDKTATGTVLSPLLREPFGNPVPLYAAPPSDPVGHGAVTVAALEWEERSGSLYANTAMGEVCIDEHYDGFSVIENGRLHEGFASQEAAQAFLQEKHDAWVSDWLEPAALSPAPEAGSDEVERLRARVEPLMWVTPEVADLLQSQRGQDFQIRYRVLHGRPFDGAVPLYSETEITDLREKLGEMREADQLLEALHGNSWDLRCFDIPTGGDDADIGWRVIGHWQAKPHERTVAEVYQDEPRDALRAAIATLANTDKEAGR